MSDDTGLSGKLGLGYPCVIGDVGEVTYSSGIRAFLERLVVGRLVVGRWANEKPGMSAAQGRMPPIADGTGVG